MPAAIRTVHIELGFGPAIRATDPLLARCHSLRARLNEPEMEKVQQVCERYSVSRSQLVREILMKVVDELLDERNASPAS